MLYGARELNRYGSAIGLLGAGFKAQSGTGKPPITVSSPYRKKNDMAKKDETGPISKCANCGVDLYCALGLCPSCDNVRLEEELTTANKKIERLRKALEEIEAVACGETQIDTDGNYDEGDGMKWIYDRTQALKGE